MVRISPQCSAASVAFTNLVKTSGHSVGLTQAVAVLK